MADDRLQVLRPNGKDAEADKVSHDKEMADLKAREKALKKNIADMQQLSTLQAQFKTNKTYGRIKSLQCSRDEPDPNDPKANAREQLKEKGQRYADHASGKNPLPPSESLALRSDIGRLSQIVDPGSTNAWGDYSPAEKAYMGQQEEEKRRFANSMGMMAGGPVFAALPAAGRVLGAPEGVVENLGTINADLASAFALGGRGKAAEPAPSGTRTSRPTGSRSGAKSASPGDGLYVEKASPKHPAGTRPASEEIKDLSKLEGKSKTEIEKELREAGYTEVASNDGTGKVWTKAGSDGNTAAVRLDPPSTAGKGYADEVPHAHKEIVASDRVVDGNYRARAQKFDDNGNIKNGTNAEIANDVHIPIEW